MELDRRSLFAAGALLTGTGLLPDAPAVAQPAPATPPPVTATLARYLVQAKFDDLPAKARDYVLRLEELAGAHVSCIGVGPGRDQTIVRRDVLA